MKTNLIGVSGKIGSGKDTVGKIIQYLTLEDEVYSKTNADIIADLQHNGYVANKSNWEIKKYAFKLKQIASLMLGIPVEDFEKQEVKDKVLGEEWIRYGYANGFIQKDGETIMNNEACSKERYEEELKTNWQTAYKSEMTVRMFLQLLGTEAMRNVIHYNAWVNALFADYKPIQTTINKSNTFIDNRLNHGYNKTRIFRIYHNIKQRCSNPKHPRYNSYGGKGIFLCDEWDKNIISFIKWSELNGYSETLTLDRIDNSKEYSPENCRWVSYSTQAINTDLRKDNTTGFKGVTLEKGKYRASIQVNGKRQFLGYFDTAEQASDAYENAFMEREKLYETLEREENIIYPCWCITDVRFPNEKQAIEERKGIIIRVNRTLVPAHECPYCHAVTKEADYLCYAAPLQHPSETALDDASFNYTIDNNGTIEELIEKVKEILIKEQII